MKTILSVSFIILAGLLIVIALAQAEGTKSDPGGRFKKATFAGGCFWCMEKPFEGLKGVVAVISGYIGGTTTDPDYQTYVAGGHLEAVEILYDQRLISYNTLLDVFWHQIDPTDPDGQFGDRGRAYATAIFYHDAEQQQLAEQSKRDLEARGVFAGPIVTLIRPATTFYAAEEYHQDYYKKNPIRYAYYRHGSGRDQFLDSIWGKERGQWGKAELKRRLSPLQYQVTQEEGTEPPFDNEYWDNKQPGIYVDRVSGEVLFSSLHKYDSGTGWPSFTRPLAPENIVEREDKKLFSVRTEVRSKKGGSHLGHVFPDGPAPTGLRYCMNSAALRFVPEAEMEKEGYGEFLKSFAR